MRDPDKRHVEYCGYDEPKTPGELEFELLGLETVIKTAKKKISVLRQTAFLVKLAMEENNDNNSS